MISTINYAYLPMSISTDWLSFSLVSSVNIRLGVLKPLSYIFLYLYR